MFPHPAEISQRLAEICRDFTASFKFRFADARPRHHIEDQVFHIYNGRDEQGPAQGIAAIPGMSNQTLLLFSPSKTEEMSLMKNRFFAVL